MKRLGFLLLSAIPVLAFEPGFYNLDNLPVRPDDGLERAYHASIRIRFDQSNSCTAWFSSTEGHLVTAGHCVERCLDAHQRVIPPPPPPPAPPGDFAEKPDLEITQFITNSTEAECEIEVLDSDGKVIPGFPSTLTLIAHGPGYAESNKKKLKPNQLAEAMKYTDDYAILKMKSTPEGVPCVAASNIDAQNLETAWVLGFPSRTTRKKSLNSEGESLRITYGSIVSDDFTLNAYQKSRKALGRFLMNADGFVGMSGGVIINRRGLAIGILTNANHHSEKIEKKFFERDQEGLSISRIREKVSENWSPQIAQSAFHCQY